jgi:hypothetical protein
MKKIGKSYRINRYKDFIVFVPIFGLIRFFVAMGVNERLLFVIFDGCGNEVLHNE